ncbi:MAG: methyltransferase domain-containing protein [Alphaproteobacteria bacterium]|nr:methyltransferase domain-containing protein [Alphaproteobacteria bacterium]
MSEEQQKSLLDRVADWWESEDSHKLADKDSVHHDKDQNIRVDLKKFELEKWTEQRINILEILWGRGTRIPGDEDLNRELFGGAGLNSKSKILDMAVGLGNCARIITKDSFAHIDVVEAYPNLLPHLIKVIKEEKLSRFISILDGDLTKVKLKQAKYDLIYGREAMFKIEDKNFILKKCLKALASHGQLIFTDFVLDHDAASYDIFKNWSEREKSIVYPISKGAYNHMFNTLKMQLYPTMDYSKQYVHHVNIGWRRLERHLKNHKIDEKFVDVMAQESDLWLSRVRALRSGKLKLLKFHAVLQK